MTTDHGSNMLKAVDNLNLSHVSCFGHVLNTAVSRILKMEDVKEAINKVQDIHNIFAHSWKSVREMGKVLENLVYHKKNFRLIQEHDGGQCQSLSTP